MATSTVVPAATAVAGAIRSLPPPPLYRADCPSTLTAVICGPSLSSTMVSRRILASTVTVTRPDNRRDA
ncbi:MAG: hypothetical protein V9E89_14155 [Ilumatobacteraceae bacterium]